ncbi:MAG: [protein-PII] uridylyltransferase [Thermodesulfobacteriota bacterium]|nr:[protein-PII] uridylyltransferase [Thermodesulfobacteriota bacterium]
MVQDEAGILIQKRKKLVKRLLDNRAPGFLNTSAELFDDYFCGVFKKSSTALKMTDAGIPVALVALGGYGRREQCVHSDIDLLVLFENSIPEMADQFIRDLLYPLWDYRLETGYAVRTIKESLLMSWKHFDILTTLIDARFICGDFNIYFLLMKTFMKQLSEKHLQNSLGCLIAYGEKRHSVFGDSTYLLEPNLKSGLGGLRDYHSLMWYARMVSDVKIRKDLEYYGFLSCEEFQTLESSLSFIWNTRNMLHYITGRKCDQLHFELQIEVAKLIGFKAETGHQGVETFMGELHSKMEFLKQINQLLREYILQPRPNKIKKAKKRTTLSKSTKVSGIVIRRQMLEFSSMELVPRHPGLLLKIFVESGRLKKPLSIDARRIVNEFSYLVNDSFRRDTSNVKAFEKILSYSLWKFNVLNVMLATGVLEGLIPEFSSIVNKIQYNQYHLFPVDKHSIRSVQVVNGFKKKDSDKKFSFYSIVYKGIRNKKVLLFAALLHDIGKAEPSSEHSEKGAEIARTIVARAGYKSSEIEDVVFLIKNHLFLAKTATRRDLSDEETAVFCADRIGRVGRLRMLYLLTVADSIATGPKAWNQWTESLLRDLFLKTMNVLKNSELATRKASKSIKKKKDQIINLRKKEWDKVKLKKELDSMSHRYLLYVPVPEIMGHLALYKNLGEKAFLWKITKEDNSEIRRVSICGRDKPGFYSKLAGVFFLNRLDIVGSQAYSWGNNTALDIFNVTPPMDRIFENEKWEKAEKELQNAIEDDQFLERLHGKIPKKILLAPGQIPRPNRVKIDNEISRFFTVIEVFTYDFPGLLFTITNTLYRKGVDVRVAMVATKVDQVVDVFYVNSVDDEKIDNPSYVEDIKNAILQNLPELEVKKEESK